MTDHQPHHRSEKGQSLVELALSFTFLLLLVGGAIDLGLAYFSFITIRDAAQEGALYGSLHPDDPFGIESRARLSSTNQGLVDLNSSLVTVTSSGDGTACAGHPITVEVDYTYNLMMPLLGPIIGRDTIPLKSVVTDTIMSPLCG